MSISSAIDANNPDLIYRGKFYPDLIPFGHPHAQQNLGQVLAIGNQALSPTTGLPQDATDFDTLGCVKIETGTVGMGNQPALVIGEPGDILQIKGATALGSILVGNGLNTEELVAGANGLVLTTNSSAPLGLEWAVGGGGGGVASVSAGNNITVSGTATNPIVAVASPLNATLNVATQNITATTGIASFTGASSVANISENGVSTYDAITATTLSTLAKTGLTTATLTDSMSATPTGLSKTLGATALSISSSTSAITITPFATTDLNQVISGAGKVHTIQSSTGGATQPAYQIENTNGGANAVHIDLYKNSPSPATNDGIAGLSYHANNASGTKVEYARIQADQRDTTAGSENGSISVLVCENSPTPTEYLRVNGSAGTNDLYKPIDTRGNRITSTVGAVNLYSSILNGNVGLTNVSQNGNILINKTNATGGTISITSATSLGLSSGTGATTIQGGAGVSILGLGGAGIITNQGAGSRTVLRTGIGSMITDYLDYYPSVNLDNNNGNSLGIALPQIPYQNLTIINKGVSPTTTWNDIGTSWNAVSVFQYMPYNATYWIAYNYNSNNSVIYITTDFINISQTISLANSSGGGNTSCNCMTPVGSYMYIGGNFTAVNGNATPQFGITQINCGGGVGSFYEQPMENSASNLYGVNGIVNTIVAVSGSLYVGGAFGSVNNTSSQLWNLAKFDNMTSPGSLSIDNLGNQLGTNGEVFCSTFAGDVVWFGGNFTGVDYGPGFGPFQFINYLAGWNTSSGTWVSSLGNNFNGSVKSLAVGSFTIPASGNSSIIVLGDFTGPYAYSAYLDSGTYNYYDTNLGSVPFTQVNCVSVGGGVDNVLSSNYKCFRSNSYGSWVDTGSTQGGVSPGNTVSGVIYTGPYVSYADSGIIRVLGSVSQTASFTLPSANFRYNSSEYQTATLSTKYSAQQFVADSTGTYYYPVGQPACSFS